MQSLPAMEIFRPTAANAPCARLTASRAQSALGVLCALSRIFVPTFPREKTKTPVTFWATRAYREMERAKRLELLHSFLQSCLGEATYNSLMKVGAYGGAHAEKAPEIDPKLEARIAEMEEVIAAWPKIEPAVRTGLMAMVRAHRGTAVRNPANRMA